MSAWAIVNAVLSSVVFGIVAFKLAVWHDRFNAMERFGMGLLGAGCLLTLGPILSDGPTPFEDWSGSLLRVGCTLYFIGRILRHRYPAADRMTR